MHIAIIATQPDQTGLVQQVSKIVADAGGNVETSRMVTLGQEFVAAVLVQFPASVETTVESLRQQLESVGFAAIVRETGPEEASQQAVAYQLDVIGLDHPGIVAAVTDTVKSHHGNIANGETELVHAPWSGAPSFSFSALVSVSDIREGKQLKAALHDLAETENLDIEFEIVR